MPQPPPLHLRATLIGRLVEVVTGGLSVAQAARRRVVFPLRGGERTVASGTQDTLPFLQTPDLTIPVGGRLRHFTFVWERLFPGDHWARRIVSSGYRIPFISAPPLTGAPKEELSPGNPDKAQALRLELASLLGKKAVEEVRDPRSPGFHSRLFCVTKKNGKLRPIIDLSALNRFIPLDHFKMETTASIRNALKVGDWAVSIDLQDAYLHIPMHKQSRKYLRFSLDGKTYQWTVLPFGLRTSPMVFTALMHRVMKAVRDRGHPILQYFDDWLLHRQRREDVSSDLSSVWELICELGLVPNREKSEIVPTQDFVYVGTNFLTRIGLMRTPPDRVPNVLKLIRIVLRARAITARQFLSLLGTLNSCAHLVPLGRLHLLPLQVYVI